MEKNTIPVDYFKKNKQQIITIILIINLILILLSVSIFFYSPFCQLTNIMILAILFLAVEISSEVFLYKKLARPLKQIVSTISYVNNEPTSSQLPNPNSNDYKGTLIERAIREIYDMSATLQKSIDSSVMTNKNDDTEIDFHQMLDLTPCSIIALNKNREIVYSNKSAPVRLDSIKNKLVMTLLFNINDDINNWLDQCSEQSIHAEKKWTRIPDKTADQANQKIYDIYASYEKGNQYETIIFLVDKTSVYEDDEESLDFIAFAAHELRGPLTVIRGYIDVIQDELGNKLDQEQIELFKRMTVSANRLSDYINNILNTERYDRRHFRLHLSENSVYSIFSELSDDFKLRASAQGRMLIIDIPKDLPTVAIDMASISEVFSNLIENAIKYSYDGGIINIYAKKNNNFIDISVEDHGIGMSGSVISNLFQKFYRSHKSRESVSGMGLGLYISKAIVESHGGAIGVRSKEDRGSVFTVSLPIYATVADKIVHNDNEELIQSEGRGWIKNHSMYRS